jgi:predicted permease
MRWLLRGLTSLPLDADTRRAIEETVGDALVEVRSSASRGARFIAIGRMVAALGRVASLILTSVIEEEHPMRFVGHDIRAAARRLRQTPWYSGFSILTLALAIGSSTAIYALVDAVLVQRQPIREFSRVVNLYHSDPRAFSGLTFMSWPDYEDLRRDQRLYSHVSAWHRFPYAIVTANGSGEFVGEAVTGEYFPMLGVTPLLGRTLVPADDQPGASPVIVLAEHMWRRFFSSSEAAIGQTVRMGGIQFEVVGVMPAAFRGSDMPVVMPTPFWIPVSSEGRLDRIAGFSIPDKTDREDRRWMVKARLRDGVTVAAAQSELSAIAGRLDTAYPLGRGIEARSRLPQMLARRWAVVPMKDIYLHESMHRMVTPMVALLLGLVMLVLLVACSNLANLALARVARRSHETAIRLALGGSRLRLAREQLIEGALLAVAGWALGILIARSLLPILGASADVHASMTLTLQLHPQLNASVLTASLVAAFLALSVSALGPALKYCRGDIHSSLLSDNAGTSAPRWRTRGSLIAAQVVASTLLLSISAVCVNQIHHAGRMAPGIDLERLALATYDFRFNRTDESRARQELAAVAGAVRPFDGVERVALTSGLPFGLRNPGAYVFSVDRPYVPDKYYGHHAALLVSSSSIFATLGVSIIAGRPFDDRRADGSLTAVISDHLARAIFNTADAAVGRQIQYKRQQWAGDDEHPVLTLTVIGVAADTDVGVLGQRTQGTIYLPLTQHFEQEMTVIARVAGDPAAVVGPLEDAMHRIDPEIALSSAGTGMSLAGPSVLVYQVATAIAGTLGLFALVLAAIGLYGVIADLVSRRTREIGIRLALGAECSTMLRMVLVEGLRPVIAGLILGVGLASLVRMAMRPLFERIIPASDATTIIVGLLPLVIAATIACYVPARRASRVDPNVALRDL